MKAISLWQPWATAMALGLKKIETRHWELGYRGLIAIHAAKRWTSGERAYAADFATRFGIDALRDPPLGAIVATGFLTRIVRSEDLRGSDMLTEQEEAFGNYGPKRFGWIFENVVALAEPVPCRGFQGLFEVPDDLSAIALEDTAAKIAPPSQQDLFS